VLDSPTSSPLRSDLGRGEVDPPSCLFSSRKRKCGTQKVNVCLLGGVGGCSDSAVGGQASSQVQARAVTLGGPRGKSHSQLDGGAEVVIPSASWE
jgi:hypothetical protein